jgi:hypothetical protein
MTMPDSDREFRRALSALSEDPVPLLLHGEDGATAQNVVAEALRPLLDRAGLTLVYYNQYQWYGRALARTIRTRHGAALAAELELLIAKWTAHGLDPALLRQAALVALRACGLPTVASSIRDEGR